jgi:type IV secretion system protein VirD4
MSAKDLYRLPDADGGDRTTTLLFSALAFVGAVFLGLAAAASYVAASCGYPHSLGSPLLALPQSLPARVLIVSLLATGVFAAILSKKHVFIPPLLAGLVGALYLSAVPLYPPASFFLARRAFMGTIYQSALTGAYKAGAAFFLLSLFGAAPLLRRLLNLKNDPGHIHGSARFATPRDLTEAGFILDHTSSTLSMAAGLPLGEITVRGGRRLLRLEGGQSHILAIAPPGSGKSTAFVIPTLQDYAHNVVTLDVKGELAQATAGHRHAHGSQILLWDPSRDEPHLARYNPLLSVRPYPFDVQDAQQLAQLLVPDSTGGSDPFWSQSARMLLEGLLLFILYTAPEKTLSAAYRALADPELPLEQLFEAMLAVPHDPKATHGWTQHVRILTSARSMLDMPPTTRGGVIAQAQASLSPYADPILAAATRTSDFALSDLFHHRPRPISLYLVIDPNSLLRLANHVRIVVSQITSALTRQHNLKRRPVLLMLDEFASFGSMKVVEHALAYLRGYWVQAYIVIQHFGQLTQAYGPSESISPNCALHIAFAPSHLETAQKLSTRSGNQTVLFQRDSVSLGGFAGGRRSLQSADTGRALITPDEILRLPKGDALLLKTSTRPVITTPRPFFADPARLAASRIPLPPSEPTSPDLSHWLGREPIAIPVQGKRERRATRRTFAPEPLL